MSNKQAVANPRLSDLLDLFRKEIFLNLNCQDIGTIQEFDSVTQTAKITIVYKQTYDDGPRDYPVLAQVPVLFLGGGNAFLSFPVAPGDECLVLYNDRDIDNWIKSGQVVSPNTDRLHSFADGFALIAPRNATRVIPGFDTARARLQNGDAYVGVGETLIKVANATTTLNTLISELISTIKSMSITVPASGLSAPGGGGPVTGTATGVVSPGSQSALDGVASDMGDLLE